MKEFMFLVRVMHQHLKKTLFSLLKTRLFGYLKYAREVSSIAAICIFYSHAFAQVENKNTMTAHLNKADSGIAIHQESNFSVSPQRVYETLLSSKQFSDCTKKSFDMFSASSATIDAKVGGTFSLFDGHIIGRILELVPNERIVEAWRVITWPAGVYSIAKFELRSQGAGTHLIFDHVGFPQGFKEHLASGWQEHYWDALTKYFQ